MSDQNENPEPNQKRKAGRPKGSKVSDEQIQACKELWIEGYSFAEISARTGVGENTIKYHARIKKDSWRSEIFSDPFFAKALQRDAKQIRETSGMFIALIRREVSRRLKDDENPLSMVETKLASDIYANLDRVMRLDEKMPTDILERRDMSPKEVKEGIAEILSRVKEKDPLGEFDEKSLGEESSDPKIVQ